MGTEIGIKYREKEGGNRETDRRSEAGEARMD